MQKVLLIVAVVAFAGFASAASTEELRSLWTSWKSYHNRHYSPSEERARFDIFVDNYYKVIAFNGENESPKLGLNRFADLTGSEWKSMYTGSGFVETNKDIVERNTKYTEVGDLPASFDWRQKGAVTPVKDQGQCGSCWSFSTTGVIEGHFFLTNGTLLSFSEQQIVDCDTTQNEGCNGGWPYLAVQYAAANGLELETDYPYTAEDGTCVFDSTKATQVANGYTFVQPNSTDSLKAAIVNSPVSVLIEADQNIFQLYKSGTIWRTCGSQIDHAVLAVGYDKGSVFEYFIVKNSWATTWGDQGYVQISTSEKANDGTGVCGILTQPMIAN